MGVVFVIEQRSMEPFAAVTTRLCSILASALALHSACDG